LTIKWFITRLSWSSSAIRVGQLPVFGDHRLDQPVQIKRRKCEVGCFGFIQTGHAQEIVEQFLEAIRLLFQYVQVMLAFLRRVQPAQQVDTGLDDGQRGTQIVGGAVEELAQHVGTLFLDGHFKLSLLHQFPLGDVAADDYSAGGRSVRVQQHRTNRFQPDISAVEVAGAMGKRLGGPGRQHLTKKLLGLVHIVGVQPAKYGLTDQPVRRITQHPVE
jgi:hypothetical protein